MKKITGLFFCLLISLSAFGQNEQRALVLIDMQPDFFTRLKKDKVPANQEKIRQLITSQHEILDKAKKVNLPIIVVTLKNHGMLEKSLAKSLKNYPHKFVLEKTTNSMFDDLKIKKKLMAYLKEKNISELIMMGANGGTCVFFSIYSAIAYNYDVIAISDAIGDFNYINFKYPYEYSKNKFYLPPTCKRCKFEEMTSDEASLMLFPSLSL